MYRDRKSRRTNSYAKALILILGLLLVILLYRKIPDIIKGIDLVMKDELKSESGALFTEQEQDSLQNVIAGFWVYDDKKSVENKKRVLKDRIEIRDNGIVWRVKKSVYLLPTGDTTSITEILQAYLQPFSWADRERGFINCNMQGINKVRIVDEDTCYLPSAKTIERKERIGDDEYTYLHTISQTWSLKSADGRFYFEEKVYDEYGDEDLSLFFPEGSIELVDRITLKECPSGSGHNRILRNRLERDINNLKPEKMNDSLTYELIDRYYIPFFLKPMLKIETSYDKYRVDKIRIQMSIDKENSANEVVLKSDELRFKMKYKEKLKKEIRSWYFPKRAVKDKVEYELKL